MNDFIEPLLGGMIIGLAVSVMLVWNGRVTGISGIINGVLHPQKGDSQWRLFFIIGLFAGGLSLTALNPEVFKNNVETPTWLLIVAGLLVGFGTVLGSGCTSGHGVCGISRLSIRSILATITFIIAGMLTVVITRWLGVIP